MLNGVANLADPNIQIEILDIERKVEMAGLDAQDRFFIKCPYF